MQRTEALQLTALLNASAEEGLDRLTRLAARFLGSPVAMVNLIDGDRKICKSVFDSSGRYRAGDTSALESSACAHVISGEAFLAVGDAREHPRFQSLPSVRAGQVVAYLGVPLVTKDGFAIGSFCAIDVVPREWTQDDVSVLSDLAAGVVAEIQLRADMELRRVAEEELERTSKRLRIILEESAIGIALVDLAGRPLEVNPALERMLGYSSAELRGKTFTEVTFAEDANLDWRLFAELIQGQRNFYQIEKRYVRKDGELLWGRLTVSAARDEEGQVVALLGMVEDLTEHRQLEALKERVRMLEGLLPICMFCKSIRNEKEEWELLESYISHRWEATLTHGCCPDCAHEHFGTHLP